MNSTEILPFPDPTAAPNAAPISLLLRDKCSAATRSGYAHDLCHFFSHLTGVEGDPTPEAVRAFLWMGAPAVALRLTSYKAAMLEKGLSEAMVTRRRTAIRSLLQFALRLGLVGTDGRG